MLMVFAAIYTVTRSLGVDQAKAEQALRLHHTNQPMSVLRSPAMRFAVGFLMIALAVIPTGFVWINIADCIIRQP